MKPRPLAPHQLAQLKQRLAVMQQDAEGMEKLLNAVYPDTDPTVIRAFDVSASLKRLQWALERVEDDGDSTTV